MSRPFVTLGGTLFKSPSEGRCSPANKARLRGHIRIRVEATVVTFSEDHSDLFVKNQVIARAEERIGFAVLRAAGFVQVTGI